MTKKEIEKCERIFGFANKNCLMFKNWKPFKE